MALWYPRSIRGRISEEFEKWVQAVIDRLGGTIPTGATLRNLFNDNTILKADTDNNPEALLVPEQTLIGRITDGEIDALTAAEVRTLLALGALALGDDGSDVTVSGFTGPVLSGFGNVQAALSALDTAALGALGITPSYAPRNTNDKAIYPFLTIASYPAAIYDSTADKTYIAWEAINARERSIARIKAYDHSSETWGTAYDIDFWSFVDDAHGQPVLCQDADGYVYAFYSSHNTDQAWAISQSVNDISLWTPQSVISGNYTYPKPVLVGSDIHLLMRKSIDASTKRTVVHYSGTPSGGSLSFGSETTLVDLGADTRCYVGEAHAIGTEIHFVMTRSDFSDTFRRDVYYFVYDTTTGDVSNIDGSTTVASASLPVDLSTANSSFRVVNSRTNRSELPSLQFDSSGNAHILYLDGYSGDYFVTHQYWNGTAWSTAQVLAHTIDPSVGSGSVQSAVLVPGPGAQMQAWFPQNEGSVLGGDMVRRVRSSSGTWGSAQIIVPTGTYPLSGQLAVRDAHADIRVIFAERAQTTDYTSQASLKLFAFGDSGFIKPPTSYDYQHLEDGDETLICKESPNSGAIEDLTGRFVDGITLQGSITTSGGLIIFDGTDDRVQFNDSSLWELTDDFTIECRGTVFDTTASNQVLVSHWDSSPNKGWYLGWVTGGNIQFALSTDGSTNSTNNVSWTPTTGVSYDIALVRSGSSVQLYIDGSTQGSPFTESGDSFAATTTLNVGCLLSSGSPASLFDGKMGQCRITHKELAIS